MTSTKEEPRTANTESEAERRHREGAAAVAAQEHGWFEHQSKPVMQREGSGEPKTLTLEEALVLIERDTVAHEESPIQEERDWCRHVDVKREQERRRAALSAEEGTNP